MSTKSIAEYQTEVESLKQTIYAGNNREHKLTSEIKKLNSAIDSLKSILFQKELEIANLQGRIEATSALDEIEHKRSTPVLQVPREVFESLNRVPQYPDSYADTNISNKYFTQWWNIGKEE